MKKTLFLNYNFCISAFWIALGLAFWMQFINENSTYIIESGLFTIAFLAINIIISNYLSNHLLPLALKEKRMCKFTFQFIFLTLLLALCLSCTIEVFRFMEETEICPQTHFITEGYTSFPTALVGMIPTALCVNGALCGLRFYREHNKILQLNAKLERMHHEDQLQLLQDQINPHLMFNVLNHIHVLMQKNVELADELLIRFADILRYQIYECNCKTVQLEKEIRYLKDVVEVEKTRWGNDLKVTCNWKVENGNQDISPFLLLPFIENAFKHVSRLPFENGYVTIEFTQQNNTLTLLVENSKSDKLSSNNKSSGAGLQNVKKRLQLLYPQKHELKTKDNSHSFTVDLNIIL